VPDARVIPEHADPAEQAVLRQSVRLAFVAALQHLPPKQRAVLILREVLRWQATEVAELLETTVPSVNSALQRARATLATLDLDTAAAPSTTDVGEQQALLARYVDAFERYDMTELVALLKEDATFTMPPFPLWITGPEAIEAFMTGTGAKCEGSRVLVVDANGGPGYAIYNPTEEPGVFTPWAVVVVETSGGKVSALHHFIFPELFAEFGLPPRLEG
jgi:RNA polymerase sigma-70 factor (ECF subfamily)